MAVGSLLDLSLFGVEELQHHSALQQLERQLLSVADTIRAPSSAPPPTTSTSYGTPAPPSAYGSSEVEVQRVLSAIRGHIRDLELLAEEQETDEQEQAVQQCIQMHKSEYERVRKALTDAQLFARQVQEKSAAQQRRALLAGAAVPALQRQYQTAVEAANGAEDITESLRRSRAVMAQQLEQAAGTLGVLDSSNTVLGGAKTELTGHKALHKQSHKLLNTLQKQERADRRMLWLGLFFFLAVCTFIAYKRAPSLVKAPLDMVLGAGMAGGKQLWHHAHALIARWTGVSRPIPPPPLRPIQDPWSRVVPELQDDEYVARQDPSGTVYEFDPTHADAGHDHKHPANPSNSEHSHSHPANPASSQPLDLEAEGYVPRQDPSGLVYEYDPAHAPATSEHSQAANQPPSQPPQPLRETHVYHSYNEDPALANATGYAHEDMPYDAANLGGQFGFTGADHMAAGGREDAAADIWADASEGETDDAATEEAWADADWNEGAAAAEGYWGDGSGAADSDWDQNSADADAHWDDGSAAEGSDWDEGSSSQQSDDEHQAFDDPWDSPYGEDFGAGMDDPWAGADEADQQQDESQQEPVDGEVAAHDGQPFDDPWDTSYSDDDPWATAYEQGQHEGAEAEQQQAANESAQYNDSEPYLEEGEETDAPWDDADSVDPWAAAADAGQQQEDNDSAVDPWASAVEAGADGGDPSAAAVDADPRDKSADSAAPAAADPAAKPPKSAPEPESADSMFDDGHFDAYEREDELREQYYAETGQYDEDPYTPPDEPFIDPELYRQQQQQLEKEQQAQQQQQLRSPSPAEPEAQQQQQQAPGGGAVEPQATLPQDAPQSAEAESGSATAASAQQSASSAESASPSNADEDADEDPDDPFTAREWQGPASVSSAAQPADSAPIPAGQAAPGPPQPAKLGDEAMPQLDLGDVDPSSVHVAGQTMDPAEVEDIAKLMAASTVPDMDKLLTGGWDAVEEPPAPVQQESEDWRDLDLATWETEGWPSTPPPSDSLLRDTMSSPLTTSPEPATPTSQLSPEERIQQLYQEGLRAGVAAADSQAGELFADVLQDLNNQDGEDDPNDPFAAQEWPLSAPPSPSSGSDAAGQSQGTASAVNSAEQATGVAADPTVDQIAAADFSPPAHITEEDVHGVGQHFAVKGDADAPSDVAASLLGEALLPAEAAAVAVDGAPLEGLAEAVAEGDVRGLGQHFVVKGDTDEGAPAKSTDDTSSSPAPTPASMDSAADHLAAAATQSDAADAKHSSGSTAASGEGTSQGLTDEEGEEEDIYAAGSWGGLPPGVHDDAEDLYGRAGTGLEEDLGNNDQLHAPAMGSSRYYHEEVIRHGASHHNYIDPSGDPMERGLPELDPEPHPRSVMYHAEVEEWARQQAPPPPPPPSTAPPAPARVMQHEDLEETGYHMEL